MSYFKPAIFQDLEERVLTFFFLIGFFLGSLSEKAFFRLCHARKLRGSWPKKHGKHENGNVSREKKQRFYAGEYIKVSQ